jgi:A/G-specific adenine glycosylase
MSEYQKFTSLLEDWFTHYGRNFPWRENREPYYVWISEIMSQQTQIDRVAGTFFPRFIKTFPTVEALADSEWEAVYPVWEGLGYYNRGKNLLKAARVIVEKHHGKIPETAAELEALPGIGKYTAHAILAFAFDQKVPAIDTNISKIISVLWPNKDTVQTAQALVNEATSGYGWNSAMMDLASQLRAGLKIEGLLGETYFSNVSTCEAFKPKRKKPTKKIKTDKPKKRKHRIEVGIACIWRDGKYLIQARPKGKSFEGSWEFPGGKREKGENFRQCVKREIQEEVGLNISVRPHFYEELHEFDRTELLLRFHRCQIQAGEPKPLEEQELQWVSPTEFADIDFLKTNHKALEKLKDMRV